MLGLRKVDPTRKQGVELIVAGVEAAYLIAPVFLVGGKLWTSGLGSRLRAAAEAKSYSYEDEER
jgi:hypothetical protein